VLRETTFWLGGALTIGLGLALAAGLVWAGAGLDYITAYLGAAFGVVLGAFFIYVGGAEARERRKYLADVEASPETAGPWDRPPP
jgi:hypothetical protein